MENLPFTALDLAVGVIVLISALWALSRGAVRETLALACWIGAFLVAIYDYEYLKPTLKEAIGNELLTDVATIAVAFFVPLIVFRIIAGMIAGAMDDSGISMLDKLAGFVLGFARGAVIVVALYMIGSFFIPTDKQPPWVTTAMVTPYLERGAGLVRQFLPQDLEEQGQEAASAAARGARDVQEQIKGYDDAARQSLETLIEQQ